MSSPSVNLIMISGTVLSNPKLFPSGCSFKFISTRKHPDGEDKCQVDVVAFGDVGRMCAENIKDGQRIYIEGKIRNKVKALPSGKKHYYTEIEAKEVQRI